jgi:hypothetical protein
MSDTKPLPSAYHRVIYHQQVPANRKEVVPPDIKTLCNTPLSSGTIEIHRTPEGTVEWLLGASSPSDLQLNAAAYDRLFPGGAVHPEIVPCALPGHPATHWTFAYARGRGHHWSPMDLSSEHDYADGLVRALSSEVAREHEVIVQILFKREDAWSERFHVFASPKDRLLLSYQGYSVSMTGEVSKTSTPMHWHQEQHSKMLGRLHEIPYYLEVRVAVHGPSPEMVIGALGDRWLQQFKGGNWRRFRLVKKKHKVAFDQAFRSHAIVRTFSNPKECRDVSLTEFLSFFLPPWSSIHPSLRYYREHEGLSDPARDGTSQSTSAQSAGVAGPTGLPQRQHARSLAKFPAAPPPIVLGQNFNKESVFLTDAWYHAAVEGATGSGKSTLLLQWILETLAKKPDSRVVVIDPHGTLSEAVKARLDPALARETLELDPARLRFGVNGEEKVSLPMNLLALPNVDKMTDAQRTLAGDIIVGNLTYFIRNLWGSDLFGPQIDHNVSSLAYGLLEIPGTNLVDMYYVLTDAKARAIFARLVRTETYRKFAEDELPRLTNAKYSQDRISSTLNKLGKIVNNPLLRVSLCQRANPVDLKDLLAKHRLILINLSKTTIGEDASHFLGAMLFARIWLAILQRGPARYHTYLFVDEFQNFVTSSIAHILTEARKYNLHLVMANQYLGQIREEIRDALVQNVNVWCFFRMGVNDQRLANAIIRPGRRGWTDDTILSLGDRRFLFVYRNQLEMAYTLRPFDPVPDPKEIDSLVQTSTRRYAADETSMHSPFSVDERQVGAILEAIAKDGPLTFEELVARVAYHRAEIWAAMQRAEHDGYISYDPVTRKNSLTALGRQQIGTLGAKHENRLEGVDHTALITRVVQYLSSQGCKIAATPNGNSNDPLPDAEMEMAGQKVNVEVECSTLEEGNQPPKNLLKAHDAGKRCLFVVASKEKASRLQDILAAGSSSYSIGRDFALLYAEGEKFALYPDGGEIKPDLLFSGRAPSLSPGTVPILPKPPETLASPCTPGKRSEAEHVPDSLEEDAELVDNALKSLMRKLLGANDIRGTVTFEEILDMVPGDDKNRFTPTRLGMVLKLLGVRTKRVWEKKERLWIRVAIVVESEGPDDMAEEPDGAPSES